MDLKYLQDYRMKHGIYYISSNYVPAQVNNRNTKKTCEICSKLTITPERRQ